VKKDEKANRGNEYGQLLGELKSGSLGKFYREERGLGGELVALSGRQEAVKDLRVKTD